MLASFQGLQWPLAGQNPFRKGRFCPSFSKAAGFIACPIPGNNFTHWLPKCWACFDVAVGICPVCAGNTFGTICAVFMLTRERNPGVDDVSGIHKGKEALEKLNRFSGAFVFQGKARALSNRVSEAPFCLKGDPPWPPAVR